MGRRIVLYGTATLLSAALLWAGFGERPSADAATLASCAELEMSLGLFESASQKARQALQAEPHDLRALLVEAHCLQQLGDLEGSGDRYRQSLALTDDLDVAAEIRVALALQAQRLGRLDDARDHLAAAHARHDASTIQKVAYVRGVIARDASDRGEALAAFREAAAPTGPDRAMARSAALALADLGEPRSALEALEGLSRTGDPLPAYLAARLKFDLGDSDSGSADLRRLGANLRDVLAKELRADAAYWDGIRQRGLLPEDVQEIVTLPHGGAETTKQLEGRSGGHESVDPEGETVR